MAEGKIILQNQLRSKPNTGGVSVNTVSKRLNGIGLTSCSTCTTYYLVAYIYDVNTGVIEDAWTIDSWDVCNPNGNPYGGDPGGGSSSSTNAVTISPQLTDPCLNGVATTLSYSMNNMMRTVIGDYGPARYDVSFVSRGAYSNPDQYADTDPTTNYNWSSNTWEITISMYDGYFSGASKETAGAAMLHELLHAALVANGTAWNNLLQHNEIANQYRTMIEGALMDNFGMNQADAEALSWQGLGNSKAWQDLAATNPTKASQIINTNAAYKARTNNAGTGC